MGILELYGCAFLRVCQSCLVEPMRKAFRRTAEDRRGPRHEIRRRDDCLLAVKIAIGKATRPRAKLDANVLRFAVEPSRRGFLGDPQIGPIVKKRPLALVRDRNRRPATADIGERDFEHLRHADFLRNFTGNYSAGVSLYYGALDLAEYLPDNIVIVVYRAQHRHGQVVSDQEFATLNDGVGKSVVRKFIWELHFREFRFYQRPGAISARWMPLKPPRVFGVGKGGCNRRRPSCDPSRLPHAIERRWDCADFGLAMVRFLVLRMGRQSRQAKTLSEARSLVIQGRASPHLGGASITRPRIREARFWPGAFRAAIWWARWPHAQTIRALEPECEPLAQTSGRRSLSRPGTPGSGLFRSWRKPSAGLISGRKEIRLSDRRRAERPRSPSP